MEKKIRSNSIGFQGCYFLRRLASNLCEPQRSYALDALDRALKFWKGKPVRRPAPLRAPWLLTPSWRADLKKILTSHSFQMKPHNISLQSPSTSAIFIKYPSVMDSLCNHKEMATRWAESEQPECICPTLRLYLHPPRQHSDHGRRHPVLRRQTEDLDRHWRFGTL
jgi:hypothetical protein